MKLWHLLVIAIALFMLFTFLATDPVLQPLAGFVFGPPVGNYTPFHWLFIFVVITGFVGLVWVTMGKVHPVLKVWAVCFSVIAIYFLIRLFSGHNGMFGKPIFHPDFADKDPFLHYFGWGVIIMAVVAALVGKRHD